MAKKQEESMNLRSDLPVEHAKNAGLEDPVFKLEANRLVHHRGIKRHHQQC